VPLSVGKAGSPSYTMAPGPRPTSTSSGILIHPTVWPQYTNVTDRQTRQRSRSIGRTVTCNGRPKTGNDVLGTMDTDAVADATPLSATRVY